MKPKVYLLAQCGTCKKAVAWLEENNIVAEFIPIKETPPAVSELRIAREKYGSWTKVFNTSGMEYRAQKLSEKIPNMSESQIIELLRSNGMLVRRPFLVSNSNVACGFKEAEWKQLLS